LPQDIFFWGIGLTGFGILCFCGNIFGYCWMKKRAPLPPVEVGQEVATARPIIMAQPTHRANTPPPGVNFINISKVYLKHYTAKLGYNDLNGTD
jgi:hypothetical protein